MTNPYQTPTTTKQKAPVSTVFFQWATAGFAAQICALLVGFPPAWDIYAAITIAATVQAWLDREE